MERDIYLTMSFEGIRCRIGSTRRKEGNNRATLVLLAADQDHYSRHKRRLGTPGKP